MNKILKEFFKKIYLKFPIFQPIIDYVYRTYFMYKIQFSGWGMKTAHELPWNDQFNEEIFRQASIDIKNNFEFGIDTIGIQQHNIDTMLWRHWIVSFAVRFTMKFSNTNEYNFVECGVGEGVSSFFALREILANKKINKNYLMHFYDSWNAMRKEDLSPNEISKTNSYSNLNIETVKKNLLEFKNNIIYHVGFIPESFNCEPNSPNSIIYLHIDLNSKKATFDSLYFFYDRLVSGGIILFDDYGWMEYGETKKTIDKFLHNKEGMLQKLPTGQAIFYKK
jgi:O-methyltransferase